MLYEERGEEEKRDLAKEKKGIENYHMNTNIGKHEKERTEMMEKRNITNAVYEDMMNHNTSVNQEYTVTYSNSQNLNERDVYETNNGSNMNNRERNIEKEDKKDVKSRNKENQNVTEATVTAQLNSMTVEEKKIFLHNYIQKIKYLSEKFSRPKYYEILNVNPEADMKTIRRNYLMFSKLLDVQRKMTREHEEAYFMIQKAYRILTDKFEKFYYDVLNGYLNEEAIETQREILEKEADVIYAKQCKELMNTYKQKVKEEKAKDGLIIEKALFGNLVLKDEYIDNCLTIVPITERHLEGPYIDLTIMLQSRVENSSLNFNDEPSFAYFCGVPKPLIKIYDKERNKNKPYLHYLEDAEMHLYIKYKFLNIDHELIIVDRSNFSLPKSTHVVFGDRIGGPFSPDNVTKLKNISNSCMDNIFKFFSKNKVYITLFTTILLCAQSIKAI